MNLTARVRAESSYALKFLCVGIGASAIHGAVSWVFYYHIWCDQTILSTLAGYCGGWVASFFGNRLWSFRRRAQSLSVKGTACRFIASQLASMCALLSSTWLMQQLILFYFWWYAITNGLNTSPELEDFCRGASYPPALLAGMGFAAICSYFIMRQYVFHNKKTR